MVWVFACRDVAFPGRDFLECAAEVHCSSAVTLLGCPRNRPVERPIDFEHGRPISIPAQLPAESGRQPVLSKLDHLSWRHIEQDDLIAEPIERIHRRVYLDRATE